MLKDKKVTVILQFLTAINFSLLQRKKDKFSVLIFIINVHWYQTVALCL